eukprot:TRINITY_DN8948_c0_g1_i1.p1 TRINITY_DN8948_c0_g1~~TRINITY_DN8948_c0_g1_i1.p1  ORF type:complete len:868 (+),score=289.52 TRINITY_DN8948_c0_g1_i1:277-2604(+)
MVFRGAAADGEAGEMRAGCKYGPPPDYPSDWADWYCRMRRGGEVWFRAASDGAGGSMLVVVRRSSRGEVRKAAAVRVQGVAADDGGRRRPQVRAAWDSDFVSAGLLSGIQRTPGAVSGTVSTRPAQSPPPPPAAPRSPPRSPTPHRPPTCSGRRPRGARLVLGYFSEVGGAAAAAPPCSPSPPPAPPSPPPPPRSPRSPQGHRDREADSSDSDWLLSPLPRTGPRRRPGEGGTNVAALERYAVGGDSVLQTGPDDVKMWRAAHLDRPARLPPQCTAAQQHPRAGPAADRVAPDGAVRLRVLSPSGSAFLTVPGTATTAEIQSQLPAGMRLRAGLPKTAAVIGHRGTVRAVERGQTQQEEEEAGDNRASSPAEILSDFVGATATALAESDGSDDLIPPPDNPDASFVDMLTGGEILRDDQGRLVARHEVGLVPLSDHASRLWLIDLYRAAKKWKLARSVDVLLYAHQWREEELREAAARQCAQAVSKVRPYSDYAAARRRKARKDFAALEVPSGHELWQDEETGLYVRGDGKGNFVVVQADGERGVPLSTHPARQWLLDYYAARNPAMRVRVDSILWDHRWEEEQLVRTLINTTGPVAGQPPLSEYVERRVAAEEAAEQDGVRVLRRRGQWEEVLPAAGGRRWFKGPGTEASWHPPPGSPFGGDRSVDSSSSLPPSALSTRSDDRRSSESSVMSREPQLPRRPLRNSLLMMTPRSPPATRRRLQLPTMSPPHALLPSPTISISVSAPSRPLATDDVSALSRPLATEDTSDRGHADD